MAGTDKDDVVRALSAKMVTFPETGTAPQGACSSRTPSST
jgi:hypothetical protein